MTSAASQWAAAQKKSRDPKMGDNLQRRIDEAMRKKSPRKKEAPAKPKKKSTHKKDTTPLEFYSQKKVAEFLKETDLFWVHVPNETERRSEAGKLSTQGIRKGFPDITIYDAPPCGEFVGAAIELKRISLKSKPRGDKKPNPTKGAKPEQITCGEALIARGWTWRVLYGHVEAIRWICDLYQIKLSRYDRARFLEE